MNQKSGSDRFRRANLWSLGIYLLVAAFALFMLGGHIFTYLKTAEPESTVVEVILFIRTLPKLVYLGLAAAPLFLIRSNRQFRVILLMVFSMGILDWGQVFERHIYYITNNFWDSLRITAPSLVIVLVVTWLHFVLRSRWRKAHR